MVFVYYYYIQKAASEFSLNISRIFVNEMQVLIRPTRDEACFYLFIYLFNL